MAHFKDIVEKNRRFFIKRGHSLSDQKSSDFSLKNTRLIDILELIIWVNTYKQKNKK